MIGMRSTARYKKRVDNRCFRGHELTPENVYVYGGKRLCRACRRLRNRAKPYVGRWDGLPISNGIRR
jgi:hypothetical protein